MVLYRSRIPDTEAPTQKKKKKNVSERERKKGNMYIKQMGNLFVFISSIVITRAHFSSIKYNKSQIHPFLSMLTRTSILDQMIVY